jgi:hypothetical protein
MLETTIAAILPEAAGLERMLWAPWLWAEPDCSTVTLFSRGAVAGETE